ncbi:MAG: transketolase [Planctomycetota bacterium]
MAVSAAAALDLAAINTLRALAIDAIENAGSGHPGLPLGAAPMAYVLWHRHLKFDPAQPDWYDRDRFVLSAGHGSMLLYGLLHLFGSLPREEIERFRQWGSRTPGHPERGVTPGVEATTGPLGQGAANSVGLAMAERFLAHRYNRPGHAIVDHRTYALVSDGDLMEGIASEAASLAGHLGLGRLTWLYDANDVSLDGPTSLAFTEDVGRRYEACGWHVQRVEDGNTDLPAIDAALAEARAEEARPSLIVVRTTIGYGSPGKAGTAASHGAPLGAAEAVRTKAELGWEHERPFHVPNEVRAHCRSAGARGARARAEWEARLARWAAAHPALDAERRLAAGGTLPRGWDEELPAFAAGAKLATREAGGKVLNALAERLPWILGGDADLSGSTKTAIAGASDFDGRTGQGRNVHFGVREHAMGAIANGLAYHGGVRPYTATFFVFADYMRPAIRLAAMNHLPVVFVFTHDSIAVGEDGPTHQPIEHLASLRAMPGLLVLRPADATETVEAWKVALAERARPTALVLSRQGLPVLDRGTLGSAAGVRRGAYVLADPPGEAPAVVLIATGAEVHLALAARALLAARGVAARVVSMPSWELFAAQDAPYRESVLPPALSARVAVEAGTTFGWERWAGERGVVLGLDRFGASAPAAVLLRELGFTAERVAEAALALAGR